MKIKEGYLLREVDDQWVVVPLGENVVELNGIMAVSESGAFLWKMLESGTEESDMVQALLMEYETDAETAREDVEDFLAYLILSGLIEE